MTERHSDKDGDAHNNALNQAGWKLLECAGPAIHTNRCKNVATAVVDAYLASMRRQAVPELRTLKPCTHGKDCVMKVECIEHCVLNMMFDTLPPRSTSGHRIDLTLFVNDASIGAGDVPHIVVEKLQAALDRANILATISATGARE